MAGTTKALAGLEDIDWAALGHAYGSAQDVPGLLRDLASTDMEVVREARGELFGNIYHQGTVYEATSHAVPFMVELLDEPATLEPTGLVLLLASIADGTSYLEVHGDIRGLRSENGTSDFETRLRVELDHKDRARAAVAQHASRYWRWLAERPDLVAPLAYLLSRLPDQAARIRELFPGRLRAMDGLEQASLAMAFARACRAASASEMDVDYLLASESGLTRLAGAITTLVVSDTVARPRLKAAINVCLDALGKPEAYELGDPGWLWNPGAQLVVEVVEHLPHGPIGEALLEGALVVLPELDKWRAGDLAAACLHLVFDHAALPATNEELTVAQRALLEALARNTQVHHGSGMVEEVLCALGVSNDMRSLGSFLKRA